MIEAEKMPLIRAARPSDLDDLYEVCLRTGAAGEDASGLYENLRLLGEIYVGPYLVMPDGIGFVAIDHFGAAGYVLAAVDTRSFEDWCEREWWPGLRARYPDPGPEPQSPDEKLIAEIHRPERARPDLVSRFPAHLHIDLLPRLQGRGVGRKMMERILADLGARGVPGVHLGAEAANHRAIGFYHHLGFAVLEADPLEVVMGLRLESPRAAAGPFSDARRQTPDAR